MNTLILAAAAAGLLALGAPAYAQNAESPGAAGVTGGASGSNPTTGPATSNSAVTPGTARQSGTEGRASSQDINPGTPGNNHNTATRNNGN